MLYVPTIGTVELQVSRHENKTRSQRNYYFPAEQNLDSLEELFAAARGHLCWATYLERWLAIGSIWLD